MPGQLATLACTPVSRLNSVDLPVFGMPTTATVRVCGRGGSMREPSLRSVAGAAPMDVGEHDGARVDAADHELGRPDAQMQRTRRRARGAAS